MIVRSISFVLLAMVLGVADAQPSVRTLGIPARGLIASPSGDALYLTVADLAGPYASSVVRVDPVAGVVTDALAVGESPWHMAAAADGSVLYVGVEGVRAGPTQGEGRGVAVVDVPSWTLADRWSLGSAGAGGDYVPGEMALQPGTTDVLAVSRARSSVVVVDGGALRPDAYDGPTPTHILAFGDAPDRLYAFNNRSSGFDFTRFAVGPDGLRVLSSRRGAIARFGTSGMRVAGGFAYFSDGQVLDVETSVQVGELSLGGPTAPSVEAVLPVPALGRVLAVASSGSAIYLAAFDAATRRLLAVEGLAVRNLRLSTPLVAWGDRGLAFYNEDGLVLVETGLRAPALATLRTDVRELALGAVEGVVERAVRVANYGTAPLTVSAVTSDVPGLVFEPASFVVEPRTEVQGLARFTPRASGTVRGGLTFESDAYGGDVRLDVTGVVTVPILEYGPPELDFGTLDLSGGVRRVSVHNPGDRAVTVSAVRVEGGAAFTVRAAPATIAARGHAEVEVGFAADAEGAYAGRLVVESDAFVPRDVIELRATAERQALVGVEAPWVDFGVVPVAEAAERVVRVWNEGSLPLRAELPPTSGPFSITPSTLEIAPQDTVEVLVRVFPTAEGTVGTSFFLAGNATRGASINTVAVAVADPDAPPGLGAPFPNPARGDARVVLTTAASGPARVEVLDVLGRRVAGADLGDLGAGTRAVPVPVAGLPAGPYLVRVVASDLAETRPLTVVR